ncbi:vitellogenin-2 [Drosophila rhopaloa]|uniref:Lipase domain-containing protein n=2 Tax=Drosophila rhopaloa TaxID=1041015 RepID=A0ABM5I179_DRORH|nr:vitellogenin-2 [Drosophila rhopaloa]
MNPLRSLCLMACLLAVAMGNPQSGPRSGRRSNSLDNVEQPSNWVSPREIEDLPALNQVSLKKLQEMSLEEGATLLDKLYHLSQFNHVFKPDYTPEPSQIKGYIVGERGQKIEFNLNTLVETVKRQQKFGDDEVTIFIQGLPQTNSQVQKATRKLVNAYQQRYNLQPYPTTDSSSEEQRQRSSSEEQQQQQQQRRKQNDDQDDSKTGDLIVIQLGDAIEDFEQYATLNIERLGEILGNRLVELTNTVNVPQEIIHLIGSGPAAHVAGVAGRQFTRQTGHKLRRITALDPSKIYGKPEEKLTGLARGDADFVDAIHTSAYGMGTSKRLANVDFYPNGPSTGVPGADNVVEAAMRATRYFAESVRPGNERNFPAVAASSYQEYKQNKGYGKRAYMGIATDFDLQGDYMLQVNSKSPFGRSTPAQTQAGYHQVHQPWRQSSSSSSSSSQGSRRH